MSLRRCLSPSNWCVSLYLCCNIEPRTVYCVLYASIEYCACFSSSTWFSLSYHSHLSTLIYLQGVWGLIIFFILLTALLSVWFSDRHALARKRYPGNNKRRLTSANNPKHLRKSVYARLFLDEVLKKGLVRTVCFVCANESLCHTEMSMSSYFCSM